MNVGNRGGCQPYSRAQSPKMATPSHGVNCGLAAIYLQKLEFSMKVKCEAVSCGARSSNQSIVLL